VVSAPGETDARVWAALEDVTDPEIPAVSVIDMGMVERVEVTEGRARVVMLPTFTGCPAVDVIKHDVARAVARVAGVHSVEVTTTFDPPWTSDRITPEGRSKLRGFGLAPPQSDGPVLVADITIVSTPRCPFCGGTNTEVANAFGPTPCRSVCYCRDCRNPFEQFKSV
jgi:ring-1,2-phenylacetyl-CoA epoxidase subunit PaaD